jgi:hypothetical protein
MRPHRRARPAPGPGASTRSPCPGHRRSCVHHRRPIRPRAGPCPPGCPGWRTSPARWATAGRCFCASHRSHPAPPALWPCAAAHSRPASAATAGSARPGCWARGCPVARHVRCWPACHVHSAANPSLPARRPRPLCSGPAHGHAAASAGCPPVATSGPVAAGSARWCCGVAVALQIALRLGAGKPCRRVAHGSGRPAADQLFCASAWPWPL